MPKPMYVWSGSAWVAVASEVESLATYATQSYADNTTGMRMVVPTSVAVGSGSGSVSTNGAVTFSGASSISLNGVFSSTYDNYKIIIDNTSQSASGVSGQLRLRSSGTDNTSSNYHYNFFYSNATTNPTQQSGTTQTVLRIVDFPTLGSYQIIEINDPFLSRATYATGYGYANWGATSPHGEYFSGIHNVTTSYDGFSLIPASGTITGTIRVYGYKNG